MRWVKRDLNKNNMLPASFREPPRTDPVLPTPSPPSLFFPLITSTFSSPPYKRCHVCWGCSSPTECDPATTPDPPSPRQHTDSQLLNSTAALVHESRASRGGTPPPPPPTPWVQNIHVGASAKHAHGTLKRTCAGLKTLSTYACPSTNAHTASDAQIHHKYAC